VIGLVDVQEYVALPGLRDMSRLDSQGVAPGCIIGCLSGRALRGFLPSLARMFCLRIGSSRRIGTWLMACNSPSPLLRGEGRGKGSVHNLSLVSKCEGALYR